MTDPRSPDPRSPETTRSIRQIFLTNLRLHLTHFAGRAATPMLPMATWTGARDEAWQRLLVELGIPTNVEVGDRIDVTAGDTPPLAGTVTAVAPTTSPS